MTGRCSRGKRRPKTDGAVPHPLRTSANQSDDGSMRRVPEKRRFPPFPGKAFIPLDALFFSDIGMIGTARKPCGYQNHDRVTRGFLPMADRVP
ncbi:MAG: hypothetical protein D6788_01715 [Planctomycetota bacterium]|nr:MAG: hypothetical protein D6788_01715 [Planctomycetota bacterium]